MYEITEKKDIALNTFLMYIKAPDIARKAEPGQFLIIMQQMTAHMVLVDL